MGEGMGVLWNSTGMDLLICKALVYARIANDCCINQIYPNYPKLYVAETANDWCIKVNFFWHPLYKLLSFNLQVIHYRSVGKNVFSKCFNVVVAQIQNL